MLYNAVSAVHCADLSSYFPVVSLRATFSNEVMIRLCSVVLHTLDCVRLKVCSVVVEGQWVL